MASRPHLSFAVEQRLLRETTLDDMPEGQASSNDGVVRVMVIGKNGAGACSGSLIDRRHVLTAAHCILDLDAKHEHTTTQVSNGAVHVELGGDYLPWGRVGVTYMRACDGYDGDLQHDLAVLALSKPVPAEVPTYALGYDLSEGSDTVYSLNGFGTTAKGRAIPGFGTLSSVQRHVLTGDVSVADDSAIVINIMGRHGDSGGPIIDTKTGRVVSVVSRGGTIDDPTKQDPTKQDSKKPDAKKPDAKNSANDEPFPLVGGPRLYTCKKAIDDALAH